MISDMFAFIVNVTRNRAKGICRKVIWDMEALAHFEHAYDYEREHLDNSEPSFVICFCLFLSHIFFVTKL